MLLAATLPLILPFVFGDRIRAAQRGLDAPLADRGDLVLDLSLGDTVRAVVWP